MGTQDEIKGLKQWIEALMDERNHALQVLADIHIMVIGRETDLATDIAMMLEEAGFTTDAICLWPDTIQIED